MDVCSDGTKGFFKRSRVPKVFGTQKKRGKSIRPRRSIWTGFETSKRRRSDSDDVDKRTKGT